MNQLTPQKSDQNAIAKLFQAEGWPDTLSVWADLYFQVEVTTSERSRKEQQRDLRLFLDFMKREAGGEQRAQWTPRVSRAFVDHLRKEITIESKRRFADRTINRIVAHLKTFAKWIHGHAPFPLGSPMEKVKGLALNGVLEIERALTEEERRKLLDAADYWPVIGGRSRDVRRQSGKLPDERPKRKGYRPWRNRAIIYALIETGMRRAEVVSINLNEVNEKKRTLLITEKGGQRRQCLISREGMRAIQDYIREERGEDEPFFPTSPALFLPSNTIVNSSGRLTPLNVNTLWKEVCKLAGVKGRTPHSARHAMGVYFIKKTGNPRAAQRQLGHKNPSTTMQYMQFTQEEMQEVLDER